MEITTTQGGTEMTGTQTTDWSNYYRMTDEEFDTLRRAGVEDHRITAMEATRDRYDAELWRARERMERNT